MSMNRADFRSIGILAWWLLFECVISIKRHSLLAYEDLFTSIDNEVTASVVFAFLVKVVVD